MNNLFLGQLFYGLTLLILCSIYVGYYIRIYTLITHILIQ